MTTGPCKPLLCNCNRTMSIDAKSIETALELETAPGVATELCRKHVSVFEAAAKSGDDVLVVGRRLARSAENGCAARARRSARTGACTRGFLQVLGRDVDHRARVGCPGL